MNNAEFKGFFKKAIAAVLGMTMAFGVLMLPDSVVKDEFTTASADAVFVDGQTYYYDLIYEGETPTISIPWTLPRVISKM